MTRRAPLDNLSALAEKWGATEEWTGVGGAGMEVEFLDSMSSERVAAEIDQKAGSKLSGMIEFEVMKQTFEF